MWSKIILNEQLDHTLGWKVEFFAKENDEALSSAYPLAPLSELVEERGEFIDPQQFVKTEFNYIGLEHITRNTGDLENFQKRNGFEIKSRSKVFKEGDVLFGRLRPYLNKVYHAHGTVVDGICSGEIYVLTPKVDRIEPAFLRFMLASPYVLNYTSNLQTGSALPRIGITNLLDIKIPVPPKEIQSEICEYIEKQDRHRQELMKELAQLPEMTLTTILGRLN